MPRTYLTMAIGGLSLAGFPFFAGFWSKDEVLAVSTRASPILFLFAIITVFLTAFYTFRMFFLTFHGTFRGPVKVSVDPTTHPPEIDAETHDPHWHESDWWMTGPLIVLAIPALVIGFWGSPFFNNGFQRFLEGASFHPEEITPVLPVIGAVLAIGGIAVAWVMYGAREFVSEPLTRFGSVYTLLARRYYIDEFYMWLIDKFVIGVAFGLTIFDRQALDGLVNGIGNMFSKGGQQLRTAQTGRVQNYGLVLFGGMAVIAIALIAGPLLATLVRK
jgi:NADH-quinone oxidoreductase subunit L